MIARLVGSHLERLGPVRLALLLILGVPGVVAPTLVIVLILAMVWVIIPPRPTAFEAALPVRGREVVMARVIATLALMALAMSASITLPLLDRTMSFMLATRLWSLLATYALGVVAALLPYHLHRGSLRSPSHIRHALAWGAFAAVGGAVRYLLPPLAAAWLLALGAVAGITVLWHSIPDALQLAPAQCRPGRSKAPAPVVLSTAGHGRRTTSETGARWPLATLHAIVPWRLAVLYPFLIVVAMLGRSMIFFCIVVLAVYSTVRAHTRWLAALPLAERTRLLAVVLPSVVAITCCVGIGAVVPWSIPSRDLLTHDGPLTSTWTNAYYSPTTVSLDHWRRAPSASAPVIIAPWGERVVADTGTVLGMTLYNPYTSSDQSSSRFVAWQFERAATAVYGRPLTKAQYDTMSVYPRRYDGGPRAWLVSTAALLVLGLLIALLSELSLSHRLRPGSMAARVAPGLIVLPPAVTLAAGVLLRVRYTDAAMPLLRGATRTVADALPANPVLALVVACMPVAVTYALLEWQFRQSESAMVTKIGPRS